MGGQGGGVLADWIVDTAERAGFYAQATSVPGVAQRTGATIYYIEIIAENAQHKSPVLALMPVPGDVDIVIAAELAEAGRAVQRGIVTPDRTTLIASSHRAYSYVEKSAMGDGRFETEEILSLLKDSARQLICSDMQALAEAHNTVISATLFGALAHSGALPIDAKFFEAAISATGKSVENNLAAFNAAFSLPGNDSPAPAPPQVGAVRSARSPIAAIDAALTRLENEADDEIRNILREGLRRVIDYQDAAYGHVYLDRVDSFKSRCTDDLDPASVKEFTIALARQLALWMSYEDTIRVADLKIRGERFARARENVRANNEEIVNLTEFMHPRVEEVADTLPVALGRYLLDSPRLQTFLNRFVLRERKINTSSVGGFLMLYTIASLRPIRRSTLRFKTEQARIERWLGQVATALEGSIELATEIVLCQSLVKGYGDTHARGLKNLESVMNAIELSGSTASSPLTVRELRAAALADDQGAQLNTMLAQLT